MLLSTARYGVGVFLLATSPVLVGAAAAQTLEGAAIRKLDESLAASVANGDSDWKRVIIQTSHEEVPVLAGLLYVRGGIVGAVHPSIDGLTATVSPDEIAVLTQIPSVRAISIDAAVAPTRSAETTLEQAAPIEEVMTPFTLRATLGLPVNSPRAHGIGVALVDSGIEPGPEFENRVVGFYDFTQTGKTDIPTDAYGHGTHVAGLIAGDGDISLKRYRGVAHKARLIVLKVLDENGTGTTSSVISAIEFVTANRAQLGVGVINLSLGHPIFEPAETDPLVQAVEAAVRAGVVVVVAAGNHGIASATGKPGYAGIVSPAKRRQDVRVERAQRRSRRRI
jgi:serine protease AprX